ncbi:uncharacterized protein DUF2493 [Actinomadura pelletieri DSM 43383]|uniref:Uncharacterized protein DUF2493 n=1 Tax=Actinomadura pelletieri DSM 43383 TaxID=1120940 RepID=A0A495Q9A9_9ACTN|nr:uncharacterized protein DUF2493 [Actinomadura pelletieri DSM 43383]
MLDLDDPRVLVCGGRTYRSTATVHEVLDRLLKRYGTRLVVIEGADKGADEAAHHWCELRGLGADRHLCQPVNWEREKQVRPRSWRAAGPERNTRMLSEEPQLVVAFHTWFRPGTGTGGTVDMTLKAVLAGVPVWLAPGQDLNVGRWIRLQEFPHSRAAEAAKALRRAGLGDRLVADFDADSAGKRTSR